MVFGCHGNVLEYTHSEAPKTNMNTFGCHERESEEVSGGAYSNILHSKFRY